MEHVEQIKNGLKFGELTAYWLFLDSIGCSRTTGWRWRKNGWIETVAIAGRPYVRREAIDKFLQRAQAGEFNRNQAGAADANCRARAMMEGGTDHEPLQFPQ